VLFLQIVIHCVSVSVCQCVRGCAGVWVCVLVGGRRKWKQTVWESLRPFQFRSQSKFSVGFGLWCWP